MRGAGQPIDFARKSVAHYRLGDIAIEGLIMARGRVREFRKLIGPQGEVFTMSTEAVPGSTYGRRFVTLFPETLMGIARDPKQPGAALPVFIWALDALDFERWHTIRQSEVAGHLGRSQASVSDALRYLLDAKLLERRGAGPRQEWRVAPEAAWNGTVGAYHRAKRERDEKRPMLRVVARPQAV